MEILDRVGASESGLTLTELAGQMHLGTTTVHNLARTLASGGYLHKPGRGAKYQLGRRLEELSERRRRRDLLQRGREALEELQGDYPAGTGTLSESMGREIVARLRVSPEMPGLVEEPGHQVMAPYTSASALAFQAFWPATQRQAYLRGYPFEEFATAHWDSPEQLADFLARARRRGAVAMRGAGGKGFRVAVPILSNHHELLGVMGLSLPAEASPTEQDVQEQIIKDLRFRAATLGRESDTNSPEEMLQC